MATVVFLDDNIRVKVPVGMSLREAAQKSGSSMEFGCRVGDCTTCAGNVLQGMFFLNDKTEKEMGTLRLLGEDAGEMRLMCQCHVASEEGEVVISQRS